MLIRQLLAKNGNPVLLLTASGLVRDGRLALRNHTETRAEPLRRLLLVCFIITACSSDKQASAPERVCQAFVELNETTLKPGDADKAFAMVADKVQPQLKPDSPMWIVLENLRNAVSEQRYEMYTFTGNELGEDWSCEEMKKVLSL